MSDMITSEKKLGVIACKIIRSRNNWSERNLETVLAEINSAIEIELHKLSKVKI
jgi:hypothetical protein